MDRQRAINAVKELLLAMGEDITAEGLQDTPRRVADAMAEFISGNAEDAKVHLSKTFSAPQGGLVVEKDIEFSSTCEHHLMPFFGKIAIAYVADGKVVGLSKLARTVEVYAKRLQLQERLTAQIAGAIMEHLSPVGVMVVCEAEHTCMTCRGVKKQGSKTVTTCVLGNFSQAEQARVMELLR